MKQQLITEIEQKMLKQLDNAQLEALHKVLIQTFKQYEISETNSNDDEPENSDILSEFLSAKRRRRRVDPSSPKRNRRHK